MLDLDEIGAEVPSLTAADVPVELRFLGLDEDAEGDLLSLPPGALIRGELVGPVALVFWVGDRAVLKSITVRMQSESAIRSAMPISRVVGRLS